MKHQPRTALKGELKYFFPSGKSAAPPCTPPSFSPGVPSWFRDLGCYAEDLTEAECHSDGTRGLVPATVDAQLDGCYTGFYQASTTGRYKVDTSTRRLRYPEPGNTRAYRIAPAGFCLWCKPTMVFFKREVSVFSFRFLWYLRLVTTIVRVPTSGLTRKLQPLQNL